MERRKYITLSRRYHVVDNPTSLAKVDQVIAALGARPGGEVLDIACGKGEMLCRIAEKYGARCTGVDHNEMFCAEAVAKAAERGLSHLLTIHQIGGAEFTASEGCFEASMCVGATWVFGGLHGTLVQLERWTRPGGTVVVGEPFWLAEPPEAFLEALGVQRDDFLTHEGNVRAGEALGLRLAYAAVSSQDEWDHYEALAWLAAEDYVREHPDDSDVENILAFNARYRDAHISYGRDCMGWAMYVFRKP
jgi:SAM-dependent methyltransferase